MFSRGVERGYWHKWVNSKFRISRSQMLFKICVLKNFTVLTGKHLCWSLFLIKLQHSFGQLIKTGLKKRCPISKKKKKYCSQEYTCGLQVY